jgi:hypothetical protein
MTCRSIPPDRWENARQVLIFYFSRRCGFRNAEDLAHDTLAALWGRDDYEFADASDFLKICYGFAGRILKASQRVATKHANVELLDNFISPDSGGMGMSATEMGILLDEVLATAQSGLAEQEWLIIEKQVDKTLGSGAEDGPGSNQERVRLFRARDKLAILTHWRRKRR